MVKVLFVCLGNICRSPTAEGVFRHLLMQEKLHDRIKTDSTGTHAYHVGSPPDTRAQKAAKRRGIDLSDLRGRQVTRDDIETFDYILAMDQSNYQDLLDLAHDRHHHKIRLLMEYSADYGIDEVPDPYYGGPHGFDRVLDMIESAAAGLLDDIRRQHL